MNIYKEIEELHTEMQAWRQHFHQFPEIAFEEINTARFISEKLRSFGLEVHEGLAKTGSYAECFSESAVYDVVLKKIYKAPVSSTRVSQNTKRMTKKEQNNYKQCLRGDFPTLCKHSWLTSSQKKEVKRAERKHNYRQCIRGDFPTLCKHSWLTSSQAKKVKEAERRAKLNRGY